MNGSLKNGSTDLLAPSDMIPKPPKEGYQVQPTMIEISRMTLRNLQEVENFKVSN